MEQNSLFHERYFLERLLGRGNFSEVWLAKDTKTDIEVALKIYAPATGLDDAGLNVFAREFSLVVNANHKNLLKPLYYDSCDRKPYLVLPYCKQGSIMKLVGKFSEVDAWRLLRDVASGLAWLHGMNPPVIHQDIKPDNVMIGENGDFMITDFGVSTHLKSTLRKSLSSAFSSAGTIAYMAPERFGKNNTPVMANDIYSLGATVYEMLTGDTPFGDDGGLVQMKGAEVPELQGNYSTQLKKTLDKCLRTNPWERPTAEQLEKYATTGLEGGNIKFVDEKTVWQKFKWVIIAVCAILVTGLAVGAYFIKQAHDRQQELERQAAIEMRNLATKDEVHKLTLQGDSLTIIGDLHDEGYENAYFDAYNCYRQANDSVAQLSDSYISLAEKATLNQKLSQLAEKLREAYQSLQEKAELFADEPDIAAEFKERAYKISSIIDISKLESANQQTD